MIRYLQRRLVLAVPILFLISAIVFFVMHILPGDPVKSMLAGQPVSTEIIEQLREQYGLNDPVHVQYLRFLGNAITGDLGTSIATKRPVTTEILDQLPYTIALTLAGMGIAMAIGIVSGVLAATRRGTWIDATSMFFALLGVSMPSFWLALLLIFTFSFRLHWFPAVGADTWKHLVLPALVLGVGEAAIIARLVRASMVEVLRQEYVVVARAKGLTQRNVVLRHALRNALIPVVTVLGLQFGYLLGGAVIVETAFSRPGVGRLAVEAILAKDFPMVQGVVLFSAVIYVLINIAVDISYSLLDPRIQYQ
jgi:peptide/nickel transport system permease protein